MANNKPVNYLTQMSNHDKIIFLKILTTLAQSDNRFDDSEKEYITDLAVAMNIDETSINEIFNSTDKNTVIKEAASIKDRSVALNILKEACILANSDSDLSEREVIFIGQVGQAMGIELEKIEQISQWVIDFIILGEQRKIIFEEI